MRQRVKRLLNYFLIGTLSVLPLFAVIQVVLFVKRLLVDVVKDAFGYTESVSLTALIFVLSIALLSSIGYSIVKQGKSFIITLFDRIIDRIPLLKSIYRVAKRLISMFHEYEKPTHKKEVVYIEYPKKGLWVPGYVTNHYDEMLVVYVPTSPNPTSGFAIMVHKSLCIPSSMNIEQVSRFIVSLGSDLDKPEDMSKLPRSDDA